MSIKRAAAIPTIDVNLVTVQSNESGADEIILDTASQIQVEVQTDTEDAVRLVIKGVLKAQKPEQSTITGNQITLTDNVFTPELVKILQGGTVVYDTLDPTKIVSYTPPVAGSSEKGKIFTLKAYSAQYDASGQIVNYECISYPNCQGVPIAFGAEDGVFRATEYTINSAPNTGEAPYTITWVDTLPTPSV
jgi:predicted GTPase